LHVSERHLAAAAASCATVIRILPLPRHEAITKLFKRFPAAKEATADKR
jgi:hypothetical protein